MEEPVSIVGGLLRDVAQEQRATLIRASVLGQVRLRPPAKRSFRARLGYGVTSRLPRLRFALPTLAAAGLCGALWISRPVPLTFSVAGVGAGAGPAPGIGDTLDAPVGTRLPVAFSDGSAIALESGARARVTALGSRGATVQLEKGRADVSVRHRRDTRWQLRAGSFEVTVTGTRFSIAWDDRTDALTVVMAEGTVEVRGSHLPANGEPVVVSAGQRFRATAVDSRWTLAAANEAEPAPAATNVPAPSAVVEPPPEVKAAPTEGPPSEALPLSATPSVGRASATGPRSWQTLARAGHFVEALQAAERAGFERACRRLGADDLVQLGDVARLAHDAPRAERAYQSVRRRFPSSDRPAFGLGLIAFEQRRDFRGAGRWFNEYVRRYPKGALAHEALGREMESWNRAGEAARARRAADLYLNQTPSGPYAALARQIVSP